MSGRPSRARIVIRFLSFLVFFVGMLFLGFASPPLQFIGAGVFVVALLYAIVEPQVRHGMLFRRRPNSVGEVPSEQAAMSEVETLPQPEEVKQDLEPDGRLRPEFAYVALEHLVVQLRYGKIVLDLPEETAQAQATEADIDGG